MTGICGYVMLNRDNVIIQRFFLRLVVLSFSVAVLINLLYSSGVERNNGDGRDTAM
jgi:hypothetical protein